MREEEEGVIFAEGPDSARSCPPSRPTMRRCHARREGPVQALCAPSPSRYPRGPCRPKRGAGSSRRATPRKLPPPARADAWS
eukprot:6835038-Pyramimonas_sp.AAC.1